MGFQIQFSSQKDQAATYVFFQKLHLYLWIIWILASIFIVCFSCYFSDVSGKSVEYTDPNKQWEACFIKAQEIIVPLNSTLEPVFAQVGGIRDEVTNQIRGLFYEGICNDNDLNNLFVAAGTLPPISPVFPVVPSPVLPVGQLLNSLSYMGIQSIIYSVIGLGALNFAFNNPTWLPVAIVLLVWDVIAILTFYTIPNQTNATLLMLMELAAARFKFDDVANGQNICGKAYSYMWAYIFFICVILLVVFYNLVIAILSEMIKLVDPNKPHFDPLKNTLYPVTIAGLAGFFYFLLTIGKAYSSSIALESIGYFNIPLSEAGQIFNPDGTLAYPLWFEKIWFPFVQPNIDLGTLLFIVSFMSTVRGYSIQSITAFQLAAALSCVYVLSAYPVVVSTFEFLKVYNFKDWNSCWGYFYSGSTRIFYGYPDELESKHLCAAFRLTSGSFVVMFFLMHLLPIACLMCLTQNVTRQSMAIERFDPAAYNIPNPVPSFLKTSSIQQNRNDGTGESLVTGQRSDLY